MENVNSVFLSWWLLVFELNVGTWGGLTAAFMGKKAFAIQLVFNTKLNQKDSSHSFLSKSVQLGDVGNVGSKLSNISYSRLQLDLSPSK